MNDKIKPALIGGVVLGVLSAIPFLNLGNICCCAWAVLGGALAANFYIKSSQTPVSLGEGALLGVMSGVIGTVVVWIIAIPLSLIVGDLMTPLIVDMFESVDPRQAEVLRRQIELEQNKSFIQKLPALLGGMILGLFAYTAFATAGGLLGTALFEKRKGGSTPPPPPGYGGQSY